MATGSPTDPVWERWHRELELARKVPGAKSWLSLAKKIIKRYRDERTDPQDDAQDQDAIKGTRFNILWSNTQTLLPAVYARTPKPIVERRYLDRDPVGRVASVILERSLCYELDDGSYSPSIRKAVLDWLLPGRGIVWVRYDAKFRNVEPKTQEPEGTKDPVTVSDKDDDIKGEKPTPEPEQEVASESCPVDYIDYRDFLTSASRTWEEVWWVAKRVYMTRQELIARFGKEKGDKVTLDWSPPEQQQVPGTASVEGDQGKKAKVWEIWNKRDRKVFWIAEGWSDEILDEKPDPLKLDGFFPVPKPLFATLTNDTLVPVSFFYEYQDQANELDDLTARISALTKAIKACGVYDASMPELKRMFEEGFENQLVPCDNMTEFSQKAGPTGMGAIWMLPIKDMAAVLIQLYDARDRVKRDLYEITGISDIVRGQSDAGGAKTATEQRIKGQFASLRLNDLQSEVARFARDTLRIMGEIISEHFDPMTLFLISGYEQYAKEQFPPEEPPNPMMGHNGGPPMAPPESSPGVGAPGLAPPPGAAGMQPQIDPVQAAQQKASETFQKAVELLRNDKLRGFRIEIETDSIVEPDQQETQKARTELLGAISQFLPQAVEAGAQQPAMRPLLGQLLLFFLRGFKAGRELEAPFEQFIEDLRKQATQPPPPNPEMVKAQAEQQKQEAENQRTAADIQMRQQEMQHEAAMKEKDLEIKQVELQLEERKMIMEAELEERKTAAELALKERESQQQLALKQQETEQGLALSAAEAQQKAQITEQQAAQDAQLKAEDAQRKSQQDETVFTTKMQMDLKAFNDKQAREAQAFEADEQRKTKLAEAESKNRSEAEVGLMKEGAAKDRSAKDAEAKKPKAKKRMTITPVRDDSGRAKQYQIEEA